MLTVDDLRNSLPKHLKLAATQSLADTVNSLSTDSEMQETLRNNVVSYTHVLQEGKFKTEDYLNAVAYVSFKLMGYTNKDAYIRTFPQRYAALIAKSTPGNDISAYVAGYSKGKLVNLIMEQTLVPTWVLNQDLYQKAINTQAELMVSANSEKVRSDAANSILTHLKKPENHQVEINLGVQESKGMKELKDTLTALAQRQQELIGQGASTREVAHQKLGSMIEGTAKDITPV